MTLLRRAASFGCHLVIALCFMLPFSANAKTVLVLGDSISAAYGMNLERGWVALLEQRLQENNDEFTVVNASISGETTAGGLRRLPDLLTNHAPDLVIIELGGNDGLRGYPINQLRENLTEMVEKSQAIGASALLLAMEIPPNMGPRYARLFSESFQKVSEETGAINGGFFLQHVATEPQLMQADGIHPTAEAQMLLLENAWPYVASQLGLQ